MPNDADELLFSSRTTRGALAFEGCLGCGCLGPFALMFPFTAAMAPHATGPQPWVAWIFVALLAPLFALFVLFLVHFVARVVGKARYLEATPRGLRVWPMKSSLMPRRRPSLFIPWSAITSIGTKSRAVTVHLRRRGKWRAENRWTMVVALEVDGARAGNIDLALYQVFPDLPVHVVTAPLEDGTLHGDALMNALRDAWQKHRGSSTGALFEMT